MKYTFMAAHRKEFQVVRMCRVLGVKRSGYYAWRQAQAQYASASRCGFVGLDRDRSTRSSRKTYGSPRVHVVLRRKGGNVGTTG